MLSINMFGSNIMTYLSVVFGLAVAAMAVTDLLIDLARVFAKRGRPLKSLEVQQGVAAVAFSLAVILIGASFLVAVWIALFLYVTALGCIAFVSIYTSTKKRDGVVTVKGFIKSAREFNSKITEEKDQLKK